MATVGLRARTFRVSPDASVSVDHWTASSRRDVRAYFLTHAHADHVVGLERRNWAPACVGARIYCSATTKELLSRKWPTLGRHVKELEVGETHSILLTANSRVSVTVIDAGHCPGAVMFLFDGPMGRVLHTGDFRREDLTTREALPTALTRAPVDVLMLDNTYANPKCTFQGRREATREIVEMCAKYGDDRPILLGVDSLGKEDLACAVAAALGKPVEMADNRHLPKEFNRFLVGTQDCEFGYLIKRSLNESMDESRRTNIRCVPKQHVRPKTLRKLVEGLKFGDRPPIAILPTGWSAVRGREDDPISMESARRNEEGLRDPMAELGADAAGADAEEGCILSVAYSLHAPYNELEDFVRAVQPGIVMGNTRMSGDDQEESRDPSVHFAGLCTGKNSDAAIAMFEIQGDAAHEESFGVGEVVEHILKVRVNANDIKIRTPSSTKQPSVRLVAAKEGMVFSPPRRRTWQEEAKRKREAWDERCRTALQVITTRVHDAKNVVTELNKEDSKGVDAKKRAFVPSFMST